MASRELYSHAKDVLARNDLGGWTRPAPGLYPHLWLWDSCFIAIGLAHINPERAALELENIARGQWQDGMLPHMIYAKRLESRMESLLWGLSAPSPKGLTTSGITQPPMFAIAVERVAHALPDNKRAAFVAKMLPVVTSYHEWIYIARDPANQYLACCLHSWESGLDDTPYWTQVMNRLPKLPLRSRWLREYRLVNPNERASTKDLQHMLALVHILRQYNYNARLVIDHSPAAVADIVFNSVLASANESLERLADMAGTEVPMGLYKKFAPTRRALETLWDEPSGQYFSREYRSGKLIRTPTVTTFMPLFAGTASPARAEKLRALIVGDGGYNVPYPLPSVPTTSPEFEAQRYWRGPVWINMNWFIIEGLLRYGFTTEAEWLRVRTLGLVEQSGFREYYHPITGAGLGASQFSWTAALVCDLIQAFPDLGVEEE